MRSEKDIQSMLNAFKHGLKTEFYEGVCLGLSIALSGEATSWSENREDDRRGESRENSYKSNIWDRRNTNETHLRANEKGTKGRSTKME